MIQIDHIISCIDGLHARPAAELANIASEYAIEVYINKDGKIANIKNITRINSIIVPIQNAIEFIFLYNAQIGIIGKKHISENVAISNELQ